MLPTDRADHRHASTASLLAAIGDGDPLALAEAYHRTSAAAYACATRLLRDRDEVEGLLRAAYLGLWQDPPTEAPLEAWVRHRVFVEGRAHLRETGQAAASPSTTLLLRDAPLTDAPLDHAERLIAGLDDDALRALLLAHDRGIPTSDQRSDEADAGLRRALLALADGDGTDDCEVEGMGDLVLGLLDDEESERVRSAVLASPGCREVARALKRGRRRIEGLPPPPDLGHRVVAYALAAGGGAVVATGPAVAEGADQPSRQGLGTPAEWEGQEGPADTGESLSPLSPSAQESAVAADAEALDEGAALSPFGAPPEARDAEPPSSALEGAFDEFLPPTTDEVPSALDEMGSVPLARGRAVGAEAEDHAAALAPEPVEPAPEAGVPGLPGAGEPVGWDAAESAPAEGAPAEATAPEVEADQPGPSWSSPGSTEAGLEDRLRFEDLDLEEAAEGRGTRALTITLTVLGALLLLAAGAIAGLLAIRIFLG